MPVSPEPGLSLSSQLILVIITTVLSTGCTLLTMWYKNKLAERKKPDLADPDFADLVQPIVDNIQEHMKAYRVRFMEGKNGTNTLSGYHMKTLNCVSESNREGVSSIREELQDVPVDMFRRNIVDLRNSKDGFVTSREDQIGDNLAKVYEGYGIKLLVALKVHTSYNKWTGILAVGFDDPNRHISDQEIAWLKMQASRIGNVLKK